MVKICKGRPVKNRGYIKLKRFQNRHDVLMAAKRLADTGKNPYIQKTGKLGDRLPYQLWIISRFKVM